MKKTTSKKSKSASKAKKPAQKSASKASKKAVMMKGKKTSAKKAAPKKAAKKISAKKSTAKSAVKKSPKLTKQAGMETRDAHHNAVQAESTEWLVSHGKKTKGRASKTKAPKVAETTAAPADIPIRQPQLHNEN